MRIETKDIHDPPQMPSRGHRQSAGKADPSMDASQYASLGSLVLAQ